jgi:hypothetical protein
MSLCPFFLEKGKELIDDYIKSDIVYDNINPFNGTFVNKVIPAKIGFIKKEMFIYGDEMEYVFRAKKAGYKTATITKSIQYHPSSKNPKVNVFPVLIKKYKIALVKRAYAHIYYRNYSYNYYTYNKLSLCKFILSYILYFILHSKFSECKKFIISIMNGCMSRFDNTDVASKKKIGILSMQKVVNHGSFLQAFALMQVITEIRPGVKIGFIDIKPGRMLYPKEQFSQFVLRKFKFILKTEYKIKFLFQYIPKIKTIFIFKKVLRKYLNIVKNEHNWDVIFDTIVIGSDEVFNCLQDVFWGFSKNLLGEDLNSDNIITYAASCGKTTDIQVKNMNLSEDIKNALQNIRQFSVRDKNSHEFVVKFAGKTPLMHLDPVFLFSYDSYIINNVKFKQPYILVYAYPDRINAKEEIEAIRNFAHDNKLKIVSIAGYQSWCKTNLSLNPFDVLSYFKSAACIVTDTFHGAAISIKYNKQFVVFVRNDNSNKLRDLLEKFSLQNREVNDIDKFYEKLMEKIDFDPINKSIDIEVKKSIEYLDKYL